MAVLKLFEYPHPVLKQKTEKVEKVDGDIRKLLDDMLETMYASGGCGLAAPQIGVSQKIVVIDIAHEDEEANPLYFVNPEIIWRSEEKQCSEEGCLSIPGQRAEVERNYSVKVKYLDYNGIEQEMLAEDFLAKAIHPGPAIQPPSQHITSIMFASQPFVAYFFNNLIFSLVKPSILSGL